MQAMLAAGHVNVQYLLILLLPSVGVLLMMGLTWRSRAKRRRESDVKPPRVSNTKARRSSNRKRRRK
jgi:hypothetical protein